MILEEIKNIKSDKKELGKFGITIGLVLVIIAAVLFYYTKPSYPYFGSIGILLILFGIIYPPVLKPLHKGWMSLAVILGFIMTRVILSILFYLVFMPMRFIARVFGKRFIDLRFKTESASYWNKREAKVYEQIDTERQF
ncbi:MAG: SxtJ family membrane protein [bacterium]